MKFIIHGSESFCSGSIVRTKSDSGTPLLEMSQSQFPIDNGVLNTSRDHQPAMCSLKGTILP